MKKNITAVASLVMLMMLTACGNGGEQSKRLDELDLGDTVPASEFAPVDTATVKKDSLKTDSTKTTPSSTPAPKAAEKK